MWLELTCKFLAFELAVFAVALMAVSVIEAVK